MKDVRTGVGGCNNPGVAAAERVSDGTSDRNTLTPSKAGRALERGPVKHNPPKQPRARWVSKQAPHHDGERGNIRRRRALDCRRYRSPDRAHTVAWEMETG